MPPKASCINTPAPASSHRLTGARIPADACAPGTSGIFDDESESFIELDTCRISADAGQCVEQCQSVLDDAQRWRVDEIAESVSLHAEFFTLLGAARKSDKTVVRWQRQKSAHLTNSARSPVRACFYSFNCRSLCLVVSAHKQSTLATSRSGASWCTLCACSAVLRKRPFFSLAYNENSLYCSSGVRRRR